MERRIWIFTIVTAALAIGLLGYRHAALIRASHESRIHALPDQVLENMYDNMDRRTRAILAMSSATLASRLDRIRLDRLRVNDLRLNGLLPPEIWNIITNRMDLRSRIVFSAACKHMQNLVRATTWHVPAITDSAYKLKSSDGDGRRHILYKQTGDTIRLIMIKESEQAIADATQQIQLLDNEFPAFQSWWVSWERIPGLGLHGIIGDGMVLGVEIYYLAPGGRALLYRTYHT